jgi:hypothetical protein
MKLTTTISFEPEKELSLESLVRKAINEAVARQKA